MVSLHEDKHVIEDKSKTQKADTRQNQKRHIALVNLLLWLRLASSHATEVNTSVSFDDFLKTKFNIQPVFLYFNTGFEVTYTKAIILRLFCKSDFQHASCFYDGFYWGQRLSLFV